MHHLDCGYTAHGHCKKAVLFNTQCKKRAEKNIDQESKQLKAVSSKVVKLLGVDSESLMTQSSVALPSVLDAYLSFCKYF